MKIDLGLALQIYHLANRIGCNSENIEARMSLRSLLEMIQKDLFPRRPNPLRLSIFGATMATITTTCVETYSLTPFTILSKILLGAAIANYSSMALTIITDLRKELKRIYNPVQHRSPVLMNHPVAIHEEALEGKNIYALSIDELVRCAKELLGTTTNALEGTYQQQNILYGAGPS